MKNEDIRQLASLARIAVDDTEVEQLKTEISSILDYVGQIQSMTSTTDDAKIVGVVFNKMRADEVVHEPGSYTEAILQELPEREGNFMKVKKILATDE